MDPGPDAAAASGKNASKGKKGKQQGKQTEPTVNSANFHLKGTKGSLTAAKLGTVAHTEQKPILSVDWCHNPDRNVF